MKTLSRPLRWFWRGYMLATAGFLLLEAGPVIETTFFPIRVHQSISDLGPRVNGSLPFTWNTVKLRTDSVVDNNDVFITTADDRYTVTLYNDKSEPFEPRCTQVAPWSRKQAVNAGDLHQRMCVVIPRGIKPGEPITVQIIVHNSGWRGFWDLPMRLPLIKDPPRDGT